VTALVNTTRHSVLARTVHSPSRRGESLVGLMGRASLPSGACLLLPGTRGVQTTFMRFAIDVVFYDRGGVVIRVERGLRPWRMSAFCRDAAGAIELPEGAANDTHEGDILRLGQNDTDTIALPVVASRLERLFTWKRAATYSGVVALVFIAAWAYSTFGGSPPLTRSGEPILGDYVAFYAAGRMVLEGNPGAIYDPVAVREAQADATQGLVPDLYDPLRNPPFVALAFAPLALLSPLSSFVLWSLINLVVLGIALWLALDSLPGLRRHWRAILVIVLAFAPVYRGVIGGQNSTISLLLFVLMYRALRARQDGRSGFWAALGLFKPQLFLVFPLVFAASRRWRALLVYCLVAAALGLLSLVLVGFDGATGLARVIVDHEGGNAARNAYRMHSLKAFFDLLLPGQSAISLVLYGVSSVALLVLLVRMWSRRGVSPQQLPLYWVFTSVTAVLVDPHLIDYDLTVLVLAGLLVGIVDSRGKWWVLTIYVATLFALLFDLRLPFGDVQVQLTVPILVLFALWLWREVRQPLTAVRVTSHLTARSNSAAYQAAAPSA
jgi:uncharacterized protein